MIKNVAPNDNSQSNQTWNVLAYCNVLRNDPYGKTFHVLMQKFADWIGVGFDADGNLQLLHWPEHGQVWVLGVWNIEISRMEMPIFWYIAWLLLLLTTTINNEQLWVDADAADMRIKHCKAGTRRMLSLALAMLGGPSVLLLDEPSYG